MKSVTKSPAEAAQRVPQHVAVIMDGNGRWARARGLPALAGHRAGVEVIRKLLRACQEHAISVLTLFAFSSENWQRPPDEVRGLMALFARYLRREVRELDASGIRIRIIGDRERFGPRIGHLMAEAEQQTAANTASTLVIAADYGGQWDIVQAARALAREAAVGRLDPERIDAADVQARLLAFLDHTGLQYSAVDFIVTPDGRYVFLEANAVGEWFWLQLASPGFPIAEALADALTDQPGARRALAPELR